MMTFSQKFLIYFISLVVFSGLDLLWIWAISKRLYRTNMEGLLRAKFSIIPAVIFYLLYTLGLMIFVIVPAFNNTSLGQAMGMGVLFGMFTFSTYSLVNLAIVREWSLLTGLVDIIEGMLITGIACTVAFYISQTSLIIK
jgi:uncharacterized membrane protein